MRSNIDVNFHEKFCLVVHPSAIILALSLVMTCKWPSNGFMLTNAFLHGIRME